MKKAVLACIALVFSFSTWAQSSFDISAVPFNQVVSLYYKEVAQVPYILCSDVLAEAKPVSVRGGGKLLDGPLFRALLDAHGFEAKHVSGVDVVCKKSALEEEGHEVFVYKPLYREAAYLVDIASAVVRGSFANKRTSAGLAVGGGDKSSGALPAPAQTPASSPTQAPSFKGNPNDNSIVFVGTQAEITRLKKLLAQIDDKLGEVMVRGVVYEVSSSEKDGSAFSLALNLLGGKITAANGAANVLDSFIRLKTNSIDAVYSALSADSRFKVVSTPSLRVRSGGSGRFTVGQEVPVLGAIS
jgi:general secretion pathway protein D